MPSMTTTVDGVVKKRLKIKYGTKKFEKECWTAEVESAHKVPLIDNWSHTVAVNEKSEKPLGFKKRGLEVTLEGLNRKRLKMDLIISHQCSDVLKKLMTHKSGWPFLVPVDPVQLGIPDYFSVIRHPMDLGTIKSKLGKNKYKEVEDFAADVRLTFSNAMMYNPPGNFVHAMAKELVDFFNMMWRSVEKRMWQDHSKEKGTKMTIGLKKSDSALTVSVKTPAQQPPITPRSRVSFNKPEYFSRPMEAELSKSREECSARISVSTFAKAKSSGEPSRKDKYKDNVHKDFLSSSKPACHTSYSDPESDEVGRTLGDNNSCRSSNITTNASSKEDWQTPAMEIQLSPKRALRAAQMKRRFAATILKAQEKKLLDPGVKVDALKIQQQKEILERKQREERIRLESEIKAAEDAERKKAEAERYVQREKERVAARIALEEIEKTVEFDDTIEALKEIEILCGCPIYLNSEGEASPEAVTVSPEKLGCYSNPLQQLGLYMKDDCIVWGEYDPEDGEISTEVDGEEGEIIS